ncbi:uncharacterized protein LOC127841942 [Dreissena polymorpha]|uniref:CEMIP domain-containing protein n=1 Tax=Dreissena polymorpha TaxID=45954 RepID=A0A9D4F1L0_DREPO|nr:uncharacterized protein LOC127841942 [Dreissena polymorpha]KAH3790043.1 hypothetical protein DPMN_168238 [Dreissena polymorpha]
MCTTKYGNLQYSGKTDDKMKVQFVRDQVPSAQLQFEMKTGTGPQVVLDGSSTYTVHFTPFIKDWLWFRVPGMERGDVLRVGVCTPRGAGFNLQSFFPYNLWGKDRFTAVNSLAELDRTDPLLDGKKYFYNATTGMVYYKFINTQTRNPDEDLECNNGRCPEFRVIISSGNWNDSDCRGRIYTSNQLSMAVPTLPVFNDVIPANSGNTPPVGYGAGPMTPFRADVNGGWSDWQMWSACSRTCGEGIQYRLRKCNNPLPEGNGATCIGPNSETRACQLRFCAINGKFSDWTTWSACSALSSNDGTYKCSGVSERTRACDAPPTQYDGKLCEGFSREIKSCSLCNN